MEMFELTFKAIRDMNNIYDADEWFMQTDFDTMEKIPNIYRDDFPYGEDGDQDFVDAVDGWWWSLSDEDKLGIYENNKWFSILILTRGVAVKSVTFFFYKTTTDSSRQRMIRRRMIISLKLKKIHRCPVKNFP